jgi:hypothetical protein
MKFAIGAGGWPIGQVCIPAGTVIDTAALDPGMTTLLAEALADGKVPPPNSQALDQITYAKMVRAYGYHRVFYGPGVVPATSGGPSS